MRVGAWGDASPQTPAIHSSRAPRNLEMGNGPCHSRPPQPLHAPRLSGTPAVPATADALTSTFPIIRRTLFMAGVWGEASPQAPPEARWTVGRGRGASQPWARGGEEERVLLVILVLFVLGDGPGARDGQLHDLCPEQGVQRPIEADAHALAEERRL